MSHINTALMEFKEEDRTVKLVSGVMDIIPGSPPFFWYGNFTEACGKLKIAPNQARGAQVLAGTDDIQDIIWMAQLIDKGDKAYGIFTGIRSGLRLFRKKTRSTALDVDEQQRNDAVLKALGIAYMANKGFSGTIPEKAEKFLKCPAGKSLATWYAAVEVGLPFADNALLGSGKLFDQITDGFAGTQFSKLSALAGNKSLDGVMEMFTALSGSLSSMTGAVAPHIDKVAGMAGKILPSMGSIDKATGLAATAADLMPVYRLLGARLAAEAAIMQAKEHKLMK